MTAVNAGHMGCNEGGATVPAGLTPVALRGGQAAWAGARVIAVQRGSRARAFWLPDVLRRAPVAEEGDWMDALDLALPCAFTRMLHPWRTARWLFDGVEIERLRRLLEREPRLLAALLRRLDEMATSAAAFADPWYSEWLMLRRMDAAFLLSLPQLLQEPSLQRVREQVWRTNLKGAALMLMESHGGTRCTTRTGEMGRDHAARRIYCDHALVQDTVTLQQHE